MSSHYTNTDPSHTRAASPFFRRPGEICNKIYEYNVESGNIICFLGCPLNLFLVDGPRLLNFNIKTYLGCNKLKLVNRQIHQETFKMEHRVMIIFEHYDGKTRTFFCGTMLPDHLVLADQYTGYAEEFFQDFVLSQYPTPRVCEKLSKVIVKGHDTATKFLLNTPNAIEVCRRNPHLQIVYICPTLVISNGCRELMTVGAVLQAALRKTSLPFELPGFCSAGHNSRVQEIMKEGPTAAAPRNFKVFPIDSFDEATLRYSRIRNRRGFDMWIAQIQTWYQDGI